MPVSSQTSSVSYTGNASLSTPYAITFRYDDSAWVVVEEIDEDGVVTTLALGSDYTLTGNGVTTSGNVVTGGGAIPATSTLRISRDTTLSQTLNLTANGRIPSATLVRSFDKLTMAGIDAARKATGRFARSLRVPDGETAAEFPAADSRAGKLPYFNDDTGAVETKTPAQLWALADTEVSDDIAAAIAAADAAEASAAEAAASAEGIQNPDAENATIFFDDFQRADAGTNALGDSPTGLAWDVTGSGVANQRLKDRSLVNISPYGTFYAWPGGASGLGFTPTKIGTRFRIDFLGGGDSYLGVMGISASPQSLAVMIHVTWNINNISVDLWTGGVVAVSLGTETFTTPLDYGTDYVVEIEVRGDVITVYSPSGKVYQYTHATVSDKMGPYVYFESSTGTTPIGNVRTLAWWAVNDSSQKDFFAGRIADAKTAGHGVHFTALQNLTGNVHTTLGTFSASPGIDSTHNFGHLRVHSPSADILVLGHDDFIGQGIGFQIGTAGQIGMYASSGQTGALGVNNANIIVWTSSGAVVQSGKYFALATATPANASDTGVAGTITWDASYIYICTATNTWKRVAIATW